MTTQKAKQNWYVVYTRPNYEKILAGEIDELGACESYLPVRKVMKKWSDRVKKVEVPLFANYVFVKSTNQNRTLLFNMTGIIRFVAFEGKAVTVCDSEIERIRKIEASNADIETENYYCIGQEVTISRGAFAGMTGKIIRKMNRTRFVIQVPMLKQAISVQIAEEDLLV